MKKGLLEKKIFLIDHIRKFQPVSRHIISDRFNMNRATTGNIVESLIQNGFVIETSTLDPSVERSAGRPPVGLKLNPDAGYFIGLDIYDQRLTAVWTDFECHPLFEQQATFRKNATPEMILDATRQAIQSLMDMAGARKKKLLAIGISLPGIINLRDGIAMEYHRIPNWRNIPFAASIHKVFKKPVFIDHNSNTVALAQAWKNPSPTSEVVAAILIRTGVSFGIVQNREIIRAGTYSAGELGHTVINFDGLLCHCGRKGCLETYASGAALIRIINEKSAENPNWPGARAGQDITAAADLICQLAESGEALSLDILKTMFRYLCVGIDTIMSLYAPDIVTIDGIFNRAAPLLQETIKKHCLHSRLSETEIRISPYDQKTAAIGASLLAASRICNPVHYLLK
jgi:predicted NBD/HSP70 family sugar kinase